MNKIELDVEGMSCGGCENSIRNAVGRLPGVAEVRADHTTGRVEIDASATIDLEAVRTAITEAGFSVARA